MSKRKSNKREPDREEPEVDLEPIRKIYDAATKVVKLGRRWLSTQPELDPSLQSLHPIRQDRMFSSFIDTNLRELFGFRAKYLNAENLQILVSKDRGLSDALEYLETVVTRIWKFEHALNRSAEWPAAMIKALETARNILGDVLDDLETEENPSQMALRTERAILGSGDTGTDERLRDRLELILAVFKDHGPGPFRWRRIATLADLHPDSRLRFDLSQLKTLGLLSNDGGGYRRTDKPYRCQ
jgi:hypothetical protein